MEDMEIWCDKIVSMVTRAGWSDSRFSRFSQGEMVSRFDVTFMEKPTNDCLALGLSPRRCTLIAGRRPRLQFTAGCRGYLCTATPAQRFFSACDPAF